MAQVFPHKSRTALRAIFMHTSTHLRLSLGRESRVEKCQKKGRVVLIQREVSLIGIVIVGHIEQSKYCVATEATQQAQMHNCEQAMRKSTQN